MSILKILDRMNPQPAVGVIAEENGMVMPNPDSSAEKFKDAVRRLNGLYQSPDAEQSSGWFGGVAEVTRQVLEHGHQWYYSTPLPTHPAVGIPAEDNGMVHPNRAQREAVIDLSNNQQRTLDTQFQFLADRLGELDTLRKGLVSALDRIKALEAMVDDHNAMKKMHVAQGDAIDRLFNMVEDLATENAELRGELNELHGDLAVARALQAVNEHDEEVRGSTLELGHAEDHDLSDMEIPVSITPKRER